MFPKEKQIQVGIEKKKKRVIRYAEVDVARTHIEQLCVDGRP